MNLDITTERGLMIAAALRGPDDNTAGFLLKDITTAVVRSFAGVIWWGCTVVPSYTARERWAEAYEVDKKLALDWWQSPKSAHFRAHIDSGLSCLAQELDVKGTPNPDILTHKQWLRDTLGPFSNY